MTSAPLTPRACDLRKFPYMPLDVARLRDSELATTITAEEFRAAVMLWCAAWHQVPAASVPDDDASLAKLAGYGFGITDWKRVRAGALRGFVRCSDGRLYHAVVAEKANEAWEQRLAQAYRTACAAIRKRAQRSQGTPEYPAFEAWVESEYPDGEWRLSQGTDPVCPTGQPEENDCPNGQAALSLGTDPTCPLGNGIQGNGTERNGTELEASAPCDSNPTPGDDSFEPVVGSKAEPQKPTAAGLAAAALVRLGFRITSLDPRLIDALTAGVTVDNLVEVGKLYLDKPAGYVIAAAVRMRAEQGSSNGDATSTADPLATWRRERDSELENRCIAIRHRCDLLHQISPAERDELIREAKEQHRELVARGPEDLAA